MRTKNAATISLSDKLSTKTKRAATTRKNKPCALLIALRKLGNRWTLLVLRELLDGPKRFNHLRKSIAGIPPKSLARTLVRLDKDGLVQRQVNSARPPQVTYSLVHNDPILREVIDALFRWGSNDR